MDNKKENFLKIFINKELLIQIIKFNLIGIINTGIGFLIYSFLVLIGIRYEIALSIDYAAGIIISFFLNKKYTFKVKETASIHMITRMVLSYAIIFTINMLILEFMIKIIKLNEYLGQFISLVFIAIASFLLQKIFIFRKK